MDGLHLGVEGIEDRLDLRLLIRRQIEFFGEPLEHIAAVVPAVRAGGGRSRRAGRGSGVLGLQARGEREAGAAGDDREDEITFHKGIVLFLFRRSPRVVVVGGLWDV